jgi:hypothetical protein
MQTVRFLAVTFVSGLVLVGNDDPIELTGQIASLQLDAKECYRVAGLDLKRGPVSAHLGEGWLILSQPLRGTRLGAIFAGSKPDSTISFAPVSSSEKMALENAVHKPALHEPFHDAVMLFTDRTEAELRSQLQRQNASKDPARGERIARDWGLAFASVANGFHSRLMRDVMEANSRRGVFYVGVSSTTLGSFDTFYDPSGTEEAVVGHLRDGEFRIWSACCQPRPLKPVAAIDDYALSVVVGHDLLVNASTTARLTVGEFATRTLPFVVSRAMEITSAKLDGVRVPVFQSVGLWSNALHEQGGRGEGTKEFFVVAPAELRAGSVHEISIEHHGDVIVRGPGRSLIVGARDAWYPRMSDEAAAYSLKIRCAPEWDAVGSGQLVAEYLDGEAKVSQWRSDGKVRFASFNLGQFERVSTSRDGLTAEVYFPALGDLANGLPSETINTSFADPVSPSYRAAAQIISEQVWSAMHFMTSAFGSLPFASLKVSPTPGPLAQNLSGHLFIPVSVFKSYSDAAGQAGEFERDEVIAHETAHEWWGNALRPATYHDEWITEGLANYSAVLYLRSAGKAELANQALSRFRRNVAEFETKKGAQASPLWWGYRLQALYGGSVWRRLTYEKGALVFAALNDSLGEAKFGAFLKALFTDFKSKPIGTGELQKLLGAYLSDAQASAFFDSYVYGSSTINPAAVAAGPVAGAFSATAFPNSTLR